MRHKKPSSPPQLSRPSQRPKQVMDVTAPRDFPAIGATLSTYRPNYFNQEATAAKPELPKKRRNYKKIAKRTALVLLLIILVVGGWVGWKFYENVSKTFGGSIWDIFHTTKLKGEDTGRVNILLAGNSADDPGHNGADLTDSIMIVSIDTRNNTAFMLSVPRDLYVDIPGYGYSKINAAYEDGGMGLLDQVVSQNFNIPIDYHALINYTAFRDSVNAVGGITVDINSCDPNGLYDPDTDYATGGILVDLSNGEHSLNGEQALDLARARGDAYGSYGFCQSDFTREQDQRLMLLALKSKALSVGVLSNPVKLGNLFDSLGNNVKTDLTLSDARRLYQLSQKISNSSVKSASLNDVNGNDLLQSYTSYDGESALIPAAGLSNYSAIQAYVSQLLVVSTPSSQ
ncbi:MAG TPA: LCP family protein [Candidatus Saccharimonadales bacterium]|nr:LCP family protein [Candidatus Saccharimonadales bacterium]